MYQFIEDYLVKPAKRKVKEVAQNAASATLDGVLRAVSAGVSLLDPTALVLPALYWLWVNRNSKKK